MKYSLKQQEIIKKGKIYLKAMRELNREKMQLIQEYQEEPSPASPNLRETKGVAMSQITRFNDYSMKREIILKRIHIFNKVLDKFYLKSFLLPSRYRQMINVYMYARTYSDMLDELNDKYYISPSTYKRELPEVCLVLSKYIDYDEIPTLDMINQTNL